MQGPCIGGKTMVNHQHHHKGIVTNQKGPPLLSPLICEILSDPCEDKMFACEAVFEWLQALFLQVAAKWYDTIDIANAFFSIPLAAECRPQFDFPWRGIQCTWNQLPQGWKHSPATCHGLIQTALEKGGAPEHLQYVDGIIAWGKTAEEVFKKDKKVFKILLNAGFAVQRDYFRVDPPEMQPDATSSC
ncbi:hypothetical protein llap_14538 [Limosa lapponica baueri]|uniref:ribonuclease H n=1 Tax=Limosa lapponica baueri TaxID=1758121 RepID=A0A2I0TMX3_LIMLA|nr:hypothetical protein llap_14538 [Limosa lapponica baueri]